MMPQAARVSTSSARTIYWPTTPQTPAQWVRTSRAKTSDHEAPLCAALELKLSYLDLEQANSHDVRALARKS
jgi:hypothetical protein